MLRTLIVGAFIWRLALADSEPVWTAPLSTGECGPDHGYAACHPGNCCSKFGWCGTSASHCNAESLWISPELRTSPRIVQQVQQKIDPLKRIVLGTTLPKHSKLEREDQGAYLETLPKCTSASKTESENGQAPLSMAASSPNSAPDAGRGKIQPFALKPQRPLVPAINWCGHHKVVALTFDDGPLGHYTASLLDDLARFNMKATFFLCPFASSGVQYRNPKEQCRLLRRMLKDGHTVAGHTATHLDLSETSYNDIKNEIDNYNAWYKGCMGFEPEFQAIRPPFGYLEPHQRTYINSLGISVVTWNVDSHDWRGGNTTTIYEKSLEYFQSIPHGGSAIVLHHDIAYEWERGRGILPMYRDYFRNRGYRFVNLEQCIALCTSTNDCKMDGETWPGVYDY